MTHPAFNSGNAAIVTGAAHGIGRAMSRHFNAIGMKVIMLDIDQTTLEREAGLIGANARAFSFDVSDQKAWDRLELKLRQDELVPSVLVNNAVTRIGRGFEADFSDWQRAIDINLTGVIRGVNTFRESMQNSGHPGVIINVGSKQGITNPPGHPVYNLCKAAIKSYTEGLQHELRKHTGAPVNAHLLVPGWTTTGTNEHKPGAWLPDQVVSYMMAAINRGSFYIICPDDETTEEMDKQRIIHAAEDITLDRPPLSRWLDASS